MNNMSRVEKAEELLRRKQAYLEIKNRNKESQDLGKKQREYVLNTLKLKIDINKQDLEFLLSLDARLRIVRQGSFTPNLSGNTMLYDYDEFNEQEKLTKSELESVLEIYQRNPFVFAPLNVGGHLYVQGFDCGYTVAYFDFSNAEEARDVEKIRILTFSKNQLPEEYDFQKLSEHFMKPVNVAIAEKAGIKIVNDPGHYEY